MHPVTHLLVGWTLATGAGLGRRDRMLVTLAGVLPDLDGLGAVADVLTERSAHPTDLYAIWHHALGHNLGSGLLLALGAVFLARRRALAPFLVFLGFHLHLLGDVVGSRGPDGDPWPIAYLWPFSPWELSWRHAWALKAWPNVALTLVLLALALQRAWRRGASPLELVSARADAALVRTLRTRFGPPSRPTG
jgi:inner membrane protein